MNSASVLQLGGCALLGVTLAVTLVGLSACGAEDGSRQAASVASAPNVAVPSQPGRVVDAAILRHGSELFRANCATCHGAQAEGDPQWRQRDERGRFRAPPLDGSGHAWHHPYAQLHSVIKYGRPKNVSDMPAWGDRLTDQDIDAVIAWFQFMWSEEVYQQWAQIDAGARAGVENLSN